MSVMFSVIVKLFLTMILSAAITPFVVKLAYILGAVDKPNARRVNVKPMPTMGGLAIFIAFNFSTFVLLREQFPTHELFSVFLAECIIILTGIIVSSRDEIEKELRMQHIPPELFTAIDSQKKSALTCFYHDISEEKLKPLSTKGRKNPLGYQLACFWDCQSSPVTGFIYSS